LILSGQVVGFSSGNIQQYFATKQQAWEVSVYLLMGGVVIFGLLAMGIYRWMHVTVLTDKRYFDPDQQVAKKKKEKPSLMESAKIIFPFRRAGLHT
jgi:ATP/ADP translocase